VARWAEMVLIRNPTFGERTRILRFGLSWPGVGRRLVGGAIYESLLGTFGIIAWPNVCARSINIPDWRVGRKLFARHSLPYKLRTLVQLAGNKSKRKGLDYSPERGCELLNYQRLFSSHGACTEKKQTQRKN